jgi:pimeloyl-ACP methyl ester carboxylesterase
MRGIMAPAALERYDVTARLDQITIPTLVVWGRHDMRGNFDEAAANVRRLPAGRMIVFEDCGHLPYLEHPSRFNAEFSEFMQDADGKTAGLSTASFGGLR